MCQPQEVEIVNPLHSELQMSLLPRSEKSSPNLTFKKTESPHCLTDNHGARSEGLFRGCKDPVSFEGMENVGSSVIVALSFTLVSV